MNCERAIELISARIDGELSPADDAALESHLAECPSCAAAAEAFELQDAELRHTFDERRHTAGAVAERVAERLPRPAAGAGLVWLLAGHSRPTAPPPADRTPEPVARLTPRPRPAAPPAEPLKVGDTLRTGRGERKRAALPDGSVVYVNQDTTVTLDH